MLYPSELRPRTHTLYMCCQGPPGYRAFPVTLAARFLAASPQGGCSPGRALSSSFTHAVALASILMVVPFESVMCIQSALVTFNPHTSHIFLSVLKMAWPYAYGFFVALVFLVMAGRDIITPVLRVQRMRLGLMPAF